ncbi:phenylacetate--CoA ligase family protein [Rubripirellula amarantea]|nr:hypothetical protein [Rubripirellula amarantea]
MSRNPAPGRWHRTGGSTGDPTRVYWSHEAHREMLRAKYRMEQSFDVDFLDRKAFLWGHHGSFAPGWSGRMQRWSQSASDKFRSRLRLSAYRLGNDELDEHLARMQSFQPISLYGYSSAIYTLARHAAMRQVKVDSLRLCVLTAEPAPEFFLDTASAALGCQATIEYGSVECGLIASGYPDATLRIREDMVLVETIAQPSGLHAIVVTVLNNPSFPLLRYQIDDMACSPIVAPESGFTPISCVQGRDNDGLISRTGKHIHSMAIKHVLEADHRIRRFQVIQQESGDLDVQIEPFDLNEKINTDRIEQLLSQLVDGFAVRTTLTKQLAGNLAGKHRWIVSKRLSRPALA